MHKRDANLFWVFFLSARFGELALIFQVCFLWGEQQLLSCVSASYSYVCSKAQLHFDCAITQSSRGMSGSNSSTELVQGRSANARHSQKSTLFSLLSLLQCFLLKCPWQVSFLALAVAKWPNATPLKAFQDVILYFPGR